MGLRSPFNQTQSRLKLATHLKTIRLHTDVQQVTRIVLQDVHQHRIWMGTKRNLASNRNFNTAQPQFKLALVVEEALELQPTAPRSVAFRNN